MERCREGRGEWRGERRYRIDMWRCVGRVEVSGEIGDIGGDIGG